MPGADIAIGVRLGAATAQVFNQTALLAERVGGGLEFVKFVARAAMVHQPVGIEARALQAVQPAGGQGVGGQQRQGVQHPAGVSGAAGNIHHRQTATGNKTRAQHATGLVAIKLQAAPANAGIVSRAHPAKRGTAPHRHHTLGHPGQPRHPCHQRFAAAQGLALAGKCGQQRTFNAQDVQRLPTRFHGV